MIEIMLTSSALILIITALRRALRGKISPTLQYALWLVVALRLLIPGALFPAPVTLLGITQDIESAVTESIEPEAPAEPLPSPQFPVFEYIPGENIITPPAAANPVPPIPGNTVHEAPSAPPAEKTTPQNLWKVLWVAGIAAVSGMFLISNLVFYMKLRRSARRIPESELPFPCPIPVYCADAISSPCLFGLRGTVYLNKAAMHPERIRHVLIHELAHRRHGDQFWALLRCVLLAIHWYNPLVWLAAILSRRDCELSCDSAALCRIGSENAISYGETLMAMLTSAPANLLHAATTMSAEKHVMAERLRRILHRPRMTGFTLAAVALITAGAITFTFGGCAEKSDEPKPDTSINTPDDTDHDEDVTLPEDDSGKLTPPEGGFGYIPSPTYVHPSGLFTMKLPADCPVITVESEDGVSFYDAEIYQSGSEDGWILSVHPQPADWNSSENETIILATFDPNGTQQVYILEYNETYSEQPTNLRDWITESFTLSAAAEQFSRLIHDNLEENIALAVSYLPYLSWRNYKEVYGEDAMMQLLGALWQFADSGSANWDQYHDMLSMTNDGLDGAYSEGLSGIFEALYLKNSQQFLSVINSVYITDTERARVAAYVKYGLGSEPSEGDSEEVVFDDAQVMMGLGRSYGPTVFSTGSPANLSLTLTGDWTLDGIKAALFTALSNYLSGTLLEGDLNCIEIGYSFRFPEELHDGVILTVPFHATYVDQDIHTLPSGALYSPSARTGELVATIQLVGEGKTAPVDEDFARGQALYDQLVQLTTVDSINASVQDSSFQLLEQISLLIDQRLQNEGLNDRCQTTSFSTGSYYNPLWCDPGYEQAVEYTVSIMYREGDTVYYYTFSHQVILRTTE